MATETIQGTNLNSSSSDLDEELIPLSEIMASPVMAPSREPSSTTSTRKLRKRRSKSHDRNTSDSDSGSEVQPSKSSKRKKLKRAFSCADSLNEDQECVNNGSTSGSDNGVLEETVRPSTSSRRNKLRRTISSSDSSEGEENADNRFKTPGNLNRRRNKGANVRRNLPFEASPKQNTAATCTEQTEQKRTRELTNPEKEEPAETELTELEKAHELYTQSILCKELVCELPAASQDIKAAKKVINNNLTNGKSKVVSRIWDKMFMICKRKRHVTKCVVLHKEGLHGRREYSAGCYCAERAHIYHELHHYHFFLKEECIIKVNEVRIIMDDANNKDILQECLNDDEWFEVNFATFQTILKNATAYAKGGKKYKAMKARCASL